MYPGGLGQRALLRPSQARYFAVDFITRDQVENYAARKGTPISEVERWLAPTSPTTPIERRECGA